MRILVAEDDESLGILLTEFLQSKGYTVKLASTGTEAMELFRREPTRFQFIILDIMMPEKDGFAVAKEVRLIDKKTPILFLSAKSLEQDRLKGFELGADDYLTKPFATEELLARINAILRRTHPTEPTAQISIGKFRFIESQSIILGAKNTKKLTTKENALLALLARNVNEVVDRQGALRAIWGNDSYFNGRSMDVYIAKLRKLLKEDSSVQILNVHGIGFKLMVK
ncbi:MAG: response regulator transcription factor [Bacteroidetes bacterium]|nr:response regulator transcription factor [Bacteroidota bacterium]